tara:strand:+ start:57 stop:923 length:867 start_codon:yes stop_codon:yes gene_type:complete
MKFSVIIISFNSNHLLKKLLLKIPKKHQVIIVENSQLKSTKKLEKKFKNLKVIIPKENLGYSRGFNLALKHCKNHLILTFTPDIKIDKKLISKLEKFLLIFKNFTIIAPEYKNQKIYKNFTPLDNKRLDIKKIKSFTVKQVKEIDWCFCIINKKKIKTLDILDNNYFMYFETTDLCRKLIKLNHKLYIIKDLKFDHIGTSSTKKIYNHEILINRNWHYSWSKFYFFRKNNNYFYAIKKVLPNIYQNLIGIIISLFKLNMIELRLHKSSLSGIINSILLRKAFYRPNIK